MPQSESTQASSKTRAALAARNITLVASGAAVSTFGTGLYVVGVVLYITEQLNSPGIVSAFNFLAFAPAALLARPIGSLVDRASKKYLIVGSDAARGMVMVAFGTWASLVAAPSVTLLLTFGFLLGLGQAVFVPSVHAYMPELVPETNLPRANAVRASSSQLSNAAGMASAGFLLPVLGLPALLIVNGVSFLLSALPEAALQSQVPAHRSESATTERTPNAVTATLFGDKRLASLTVVNTVMYGLSAPIVVTVPFIVKQSAGAGSPLTGLVFAAMVMGGLAGFAFASMVARKYRREGEMIRVALLLGALALSLVAVSPVTAILFIAAPLFGATAAIVHVGVITLIQRITPPGGRGRVFAAIEAFAAAAAPVGYVVGGLLGSVLLSRLQVIYAGLSGIVIVVLLMTFAALRTPASSPAERTSEQDY